MSTRILLADDHRLMREGVRGLLEKVPGMRVVGEAEDGVSAVSLARELSPDVVMMDVTMPIMNGIEATRRIVADSPNVRVIALTMHSDKRFVTAMLKAGASGYLLKSCAAAELAEAIRTVLAGETYVSHDVGREE